MFVTMGMALAEDIVEDLQKGQKQGQGPKPLFPTKCRVLPYEITDVLGMVDPTDGKAYLILKVVSSKTKHSKKPLAIPISELCEISRNVKRVRGAGP